MTQSYMFTGEGAQLTEEPKWSEEQIKVYVSFVEKTLETWECPLPKNMKGCNLETEDMPESVSETLQEWANEGRNGATLLQAQSKAYQHMFGRRPSEEDLFALVEDRRGYYRKKNADEGRRQFLINSFQTTLSEAPFKLEDQSKTPSDIVSADGTTTAQSEAATEKPATSADTDTKRSSG